jgi:hypothetical protein
MHAEASLPQHQIELIQQGRVCESRKTVCDELSVQKIALRFELSK